MKKIAYFFRKMVQIFFCVSIIGGVAFLCAQKTNAECGTDTVSDADDNIYGTVKVGTQCWLDRNMNVGMMVDGRITQTDNRKIEKYCYGNTENSCESDGGFYSWDEAMQYVADDGARGICPFGYHIPTKNDLDILDDFLKDNGQTCDTSNTYGCSGIGTKIKVGGESGLNISLAGYHNMGDVFNDRATSANFWLSQESDKDAWFWKLGLYEDNKSKVYRAPYSKMFSFSVRCIKSPETTLSITFPEPDQYSATSYIPIFFTLKTTLSKSSSDNLFSKIERKNKARVYINNQAIVTLRQKGESEDGMKLWTGEYHMPRFVEPFRFAGTLETADCKNDIGTKLSFDINDPTPGTTVIRVVEKDGTLKNEQASTPLYAPVFPKKDRSFFSHALLFLLDHFGFSLDEPKTEESKIETKITYVDEVERERKEKEWTSQKLRSWCGKPVEKASVLPSDFVISYKKPAFGLVAVGNILYATESSGSICRCDTATGCDTFDDWTISRTIPAGETLFFDALDGILYSGGSRMGIAVINRCDTATGCDEELDWKTSFTLNLKSGANGSVSVMELDSVHRILYAGISSAGSNDAAIYRCDLSTLCDEQDDWILSFSPHDAGVNGIISMTFDPIRGIIYAGSNFWSSNIYRCDTSTGCDEQLDWTLSASFASPSNMETQGLYYFDGAIYAGMYYSGLARCDISTDCDQSSDWKMVSTNFGTIRSFYSYKGIIYAMRNYGRGIIYSCEASTGCEDQEDWSIYFEPVPNVTNISHLVAVDNVLYVTTSNSLFRKDLNSY